MSEVVFAFLDRDGVDDAADGVPQDLDGAGFGRSQEHLEFREDVRNGIEIGRIRWQILQRGADRFNQFSDPIDLGAGEMVHHDEVAGRQSRRQALAHVHPKKRRRPWGRPG